MLGRRKLRGYNKAGELFPFFCTGRRVLFSTPVSKPGLMMKRQLVFGLQGQVQVAWQGQLGCLDMHSLDIEVVREYGGDVQLVRCSAQLWL